MLCYVIIIDTCKNLFGLNYKQNFEIIKNIAECQITNPSNSIKILF